MRRQSLALWVAYDVASSAYIFMIPGFAYAAYFRSYVAGDGPFADALWSGVVATSLLSAGAAAPLVGAVADATGGRRVILAGSTILCCLATAFLATVGKGAVLFGALWFIVAHVGYLLAAGIYDSFLPLVSKRKRTAATSGLGWSLGYLGGIAAFVLCLPFIRGGLGEGNIANFRMTFMVTAGFFFIVALPTLLFLPHSGIRGESGATVDRLLSSPYARVWNTITSWRKNREAFKFLLAYYLINDGVVTVCSLAKPKTVAGDGLSEICRASRARVCRVGWQPCLSLASTVWGRRIPPDLVSGSRTHPLYPLKKARQASRLQDVASPGRWGAFDDRVSFPAAS